MKDSRFFENVLAHTDDAIAVLDSNGSVIYVNDTLLRIGVYTKEETLATNSSQLFKSGKIDINIYDIVKKEKRQVTAFENFALGVDNRTSNCLVTHSPIINDNGEIEMIIVTIKDLNLLNRSIRNTSVGRNKFKVDESLAFSSDNQEVASPVYQSRVMNDLFAIANTIADTDATVLIMGESGVGKDVLANYLHAHSRNKKNRMISINCATLSESLLESELFGYKKGSFTNATEDKEGLIVAANKSTLFLDENDSLSLPLQAKLLRAIESHEVRPLGSTKTVSVDFRLIVATNSNLEELVEQGRFRKDLYYRLAVLPLTIPALRDRVEDIPVLANHFMNLFSKKYGRSKALSKEAKVQLEKYSWPGNVRELRNLMERIILLTDISSTVIHKIPDTLLDPRKIILEQNNLAVQIGPNHDVSDVVVNDGLGYKEQILELEKKFILEAVDKYGSYDKAAKALGVAKSTLIRKANKVANLQQN